MALNLWAPSEQTKKDVLVEFRAGRMTFSPNSKMVDPDKRKGLVQLKQSPEDNLIHFLWKDRTTGTEVLKLILFPGDATFRKVDEAKSGRIFVLEWKTTDKKEFFWMQEPKDEKDKEFCDNINKFINEPPAPSQNTGAGGLGGLGAALGGMDQAQLRQLLQAGGLGGMDPMQLLQMFGGGGEGLGALGSAAAGGRGQPRSGGGGGGSSGAGATGGAPPPSRTIPSTRPPPSSAAAAPALNRNTLQSILDGLIAQNPGQVPVVPSGQAPGQATEDGGDKKEDKKEDVEEKMEEVTEDGGEDKMEDKKEEEKKEEQ